MNNNSNLNNYHHLNNNPSSIKSTNTTSNTVSGPYCGLPSHFIEERQDGIFRKVRGILNKITPETFDKLSKELVNVGLDSPRTLRGVIYLLFDKALKDLKYSSLYAKLCQELSEKAPNFEQEPGPNTFCKFLISKCEDEFERRRKATEDFDGKNELSDEEFELKAIAKQKMLGNIKFICELGKKRLLQEEILHECIRGLLSKKKERPLQDQAQDLECLCQIMRTIGCLLDIQASKNLMNQYFDRIDMFSKKPELPSRIRFMLRDVIDLRNNNWRPRPFQREDNVPQPLSKLREEAGYDPNVAKAIDKFGNSRSLIGISDLSKLHGNKMSMYLDDEPSFTTTTDFHWGPTILPFDQSFDAFSSSTTEVRPSVANKNSSSKILGPGLHTIKPPAQIHHNDSLPELSSVRYERQTANLANERRSEIKRSNDYGLNFGSERKMINDPINVNVRNDRDPFSTSNLRNRPSNIINPSPRILRQDDHSPIASRRFSDVKPNQFSKAENLSPDRTPRRPLDSNQQPIPQHHQHVVPMPLQGNVQPNFRPDIQPRQTQLDNRDRRHLRSDQHDLEHRYNRFSNGSNYRQARVDRPQFRDQHHFERPQIPESEMNLNWRSKPSFATPAAPAIATTAATTAKPAQPTILPEPVYAFSAHLRQPISRSDSIPDPAKAAGERLSRLTLADNRSSFQASEIRRKLEDPDIKDKVASHKSTETTVTENDSADKPTTVKSYSSSQPHRADQIPAVPSRFEPRQQSGPILRNLQNSPPGPPTWRSSQNTGQHQAPSHAQSNNYRQAPRVMQSDAPDRRDHRRPYAPPYAQHDQDRPPLRHTDNGTQHHERSGFRPPHQPFNRVQHNDNDLDKLPNWRKFHDGLSSSSNKEQVAPTLTPLLPKPPTRITDTNFSLRPSHNLTGRTKTTHQLAAVKSVTQQDGIVGGGDITLKADGESVKDASLKQTTKYNSDISTTNPQIGVVQSVKVGQETDKGSISQNGSPIKSAAKELHVKKFESVILELLDEAQANMNRIASKVKDLKVPKCYQQDCLASAIKQFISKSEDDRERVRKLITLLVPSIFDSSNLVEAFKLIFEQLHALEIEIPRVKSIVAEFLSNAVLNNLVTLDELGNVLEGGKHHPLFLLFLQKLNQSAGQTWLSEKFVASKINLMDMLPEIDRSKDRLAIILKDRCLGFLDPVLTVEPDLWEQMKERGSSPTAIYRWIKDNIDQAIRGSPSFAHVFMTCLLKYIHEIVNDKCKNIGTKDESEGSQSSKSSPSSSSQSTNDVEKELLTKYQPILHAVFKDKQMQLATLYALQSFYHNLDFPKGALLRWFHMMYDMNIVDDEVFFIWKEEINDEVPGKGQALFQVNTWLNWLAVDDSEEDEEV